MNRAYLFAPPDTVPDWSAHASVLPIEVVTGEQPLALVEQHLPDEPVVVLLPVDEQDLGSVKTLRSLRVSHPSCVVAAFSRTSPSQDFLAYAYREGLSDLLMTEASEEETRFRLRRLSKQLTERTAAQRLLELQATKLEALTEARASREDARALWQHKAIKLVNACRLLTAGAVGPGEVAVVSESRSRRQKIIDACEFLGVPVQGFGSGRSFIDALPQGVPKVVLSDGVLPDMDVVELIKQLRHGKQAQQTYVIAWSEEDGYGPGSGVDDCTPKSAYPDGVELAVACILVGLGGMVQVQPAG